MAPSHVQHDSSNHPAAGSTLPPPPSESPHNATPHNVDFGPQINPPMSQFEVGRDDVTFDQNPKAMHTSFHGEWELDVPQREGDAPPWDGTWTGQPNLRQEDGVATVNGCRVVLHR